mmetsp:Transcript_27596/g.92696  ORF Transcript_27596/g.92696 Transcript_27596/m.92696 type:complete len:231 (-) Transcript_27596:290-982(-)
MCFRTSNNEPRNCREDVVPFAAVGAEGKRQRRAAGGVGGHGDTLRFAELRGAWAELVAVHLLLQLEAVHLVLQQRKLEAPLALHDIGPRGGDERAVDGVVDVLTSPRFVRAGKRHAAQQFGDACGVAVVRRRLGRRAAVVALGDFSAAAEQSVRERDVVGVVHARIMKCSPHRPVDAVDLREAKVDEVRDGVDGGVLDGLVQRQRLGRRRQPQRVGARAGRDVCKRRNVV